MLDTKMVQFARRPATPEPKPMELLCNGFTRLLFQLLFEESQINYEKVSKVFSHDESFHTKLQCVKWFQIIN